MNIKNMGIFKKTIEASPQPNKLTPLEEAKKEAEETHTKSIKLYDELHKNPDNYQLEREAGYASVEWTEAQEKLEKLEEAEKLKKKQGE